MHVETDSLFSVTVGHDGYASIDFQDSAALRTLTRCLLKEDWELDVDLREDRLVPTVGLHTSPHVLYSN
jgi:23S rRNA A1618 N6-methylase RlmF